MMGRLRGLCRALLSLEDTPHRIALAFGIGVWIAFSPLLGFHTLIALGLGFLTRLSRAALLIGAYLTNPWTLAPLYGAGTLLGCWLLGIPIEGASVVFEALRAGSAQQLWPVLGRYLWPFLLGNFLLGTSGAVVGYAAMRLALERRRAPRGQAASEGAAS